MQQGPRPDGHTHNDGAPHPALSPTGRGNGTKARPRPGPPRRAPTNGNVNARGQRHARGHGLGQPVATGKRQPFGRLSSSLSSTGSDREPVERSLRAEGGAGKSKAFGAGPGHGQQQGHTDPRNGSTASAGPRVGKPPVPNDPPHPTLSRRGRGNNGKAHVKGRARYISPLRRALQRPNRWWFVAHGALFGANGMPKIASTL